MPVEEILENARTLGARNVDPAMHYRQAAGAVKSEASNLPEAPQMGKICAVLRHML